MDCRAPHPLAQAGSSSGRATQTRRRRPSPWTGFKKLSLFFLLPFVLCVIVLLLVSLWFVRKVSSRVFTDRWTDSGGG